MHSYNTIPSYNAILSPSAIQSYNTQLQYNTELQINPGLQYSMLQPHYLCIEKFAFWFISHKIIQ